ncbi:hypothetical protein [Marinomonas ostreistagni]|uniref:4-hydroxyphenylpyruvate dioxygenase n=1 Tax=Marinomonas ostreistagni TaxID=359209 RepID=A0ABS0Z840_9GAMM|nr:hypothetical protein [Marinomonas ostreistagni]MBJ7549603.1 hypothetical protein [Marinomonas ostreistagni]
MTAHTLDKKPSVLGLEFIEIVAQDIDNVRAYLNQLGFTLTSKHRRKQVYLFQQGQTKIIVNASDDLTAEAYFNELGISVYAIALRCYQAADVYHNAIELGGWDKSNHSGPMEINIPGIEGVGGTSLYFIDQPRENLSVYDIDFIELDEQTENTKAIERFTAVNFTVEKQRAQALTIWLQRLLDLKEGSSTVELPDGFQIRFTEDADDNEHCDFINSLHVQLVASCQLDRLPRLQNSAFEIRG